MREKWRPIEGYGDCYSVSNTGRVMRTSPRNIKRGGANGRPSRAAPFRPSECRSYLNSGGYPQVRIGPTGHQKTVCVHRLVAKAFVPNPSNLTVVNHKNGKKADNRPKNLEWVTQSQNVLHAIANGLQRMLRGSAHGNAKLNEADIPRIRSDKRNTLLIAADYGVDRSLIYMIRARKIWGHVP